MKILVDVDISYVYIVMGHDNKTPFAAFLDYHDVIIYIRRNKFDKNRIFKIKSEEWYEPAVDISESVYKNAYNRFEHWSDKNYEI